MPDPFEPITMLIGSRAKRSIRLMLLNPSTVIQSSAAIGNQLGSPRSRSYGCSPAASAASRASIARAPDSELGIE